MDRRAYLVATSAVLAAIAGCSGDDEPETESSGGDGDGEVVLREVIGSESGMDGDTGGGGTGGDNNGRAFPQELAAGDRLDVKIDNRGFVTELEVRAPDGELIVERSIAEVDTVTVEAEQDGEYTIRVVPDPSAEVQFTLYAAGDEGGS